MLELYSVGPALVTGRKGDPPSCHDAALRSGVSVKTGLRWSELLVVADHSAGSEGMRHNGGVTSPEDVLQRVEGRQLFGLDPGGYAAGRPDYPSFVYDRLRDRCGLTAGIRVLEIGPGTGIVTRRLLAADARVVAVEPDASLASYLRSAIASEDLQIIGSSLEEADLDSGPFDLAVAATSFHWVDQEVGLRKLNGLMRPGGWIALWWTLFRDPSRPDPFSTEVEGLLGPTTRGAFDEPGRPPFQLDREYRQHDLARWAQAEEVTGELVPWTCVLTPSQARALYASMATVIRRSNSEQDRLLDEIEELAAETFNGRVERHFVTALYTGRRS
jgi:SAM-dependent methyltransferase